ncbi:MAG: hypothetical protein EXR86_03670 [Gammaproteobacteria bacterium]|nr:hypothetical protein [Gammaproteobacteria bacterium]
MPQLCALALLAIFSGQCLAAEIRAFSLAQTEALGRALYELDRRASIAAEMVDEHYDPQAEGIVSWVVDGDAKHTVVRFIKRGDVAMEAVVDAEFNDLLLPVLKRPTDRRLTPFQQAQVAAREIAQPYLRTPCARNYDSAALHDPSGNGLLIYALALPENKAEIPIGGHHRFSMSADGKTMRKADALSTSCVTTDLEKLRAADGVSGLAIRANLSDIPLETHVYLSLLHKVSLYVVTRDLKMWKIEAGKMRVVREKPGELSTAESSPSAPGWE